MFVKKKVIESTSGGKIFVYNRTTEMCYIHRRSKVERTSNNRQAKFVIDPSINGHENTFQLGSFDTRRRYILCSIVLITPNNSKNDSTLYIPKYREVIQRVQYTKMSMPGGKSIAIFWVNYLRLAERDIAPTTRYNFSKLHIACHRYV